LADNFGDGIFWDAYKDLERQFQQFLDYVPYDGNEETYSFRLLNLVAGIGGHVDSAFKEMARFPKFSSNPDCQKILRKISESEQRMKVGKGPVPISIGLCLEAFKTEYDISSRTVVFKRLPERKCLVPFKPFNQTTNAPEWWEIYNGLKHDLGKNLRNANLKNTVEALSGAFLLNVIHEPAVLRLYDYNVIKFPAVTRGTRREGSMAFPRHLVEEQLKNKKKFDGEVETSLFIYNYGL
jgi:hypothetical protein